MTSVNHLMASVPRVTSEKPMVAPTMLCVPEMGNLRKVATSSQTPLPPSAARLPIISSVSELLYTDGSTIPLRIVSDTW